MGEDISQPEMLVKSILLVDQTARIIHCGDERTPHIDGVARRINCEGDRRCLMSFRLKAFADLGLAEPAIYVDTDMLCVTPINAAELTKNNPIRFCARQFNLDWGFNGNFAGLDFSEYDKLPMGEVFPYVACATATTNSEIWRQLHEILERLDSKFKFWYGDQEAIKRYCAAADLHLEAGLPETVFGCLPDYPDFTAQAALIHFKGAKRKEGMIHAFKKLFK